MTKQKSKVICITERFETAPEQQTYLLDIEEVRKVSPRYAEILDASVSNYKYFFKNRPEKYSYEKYRELEKKLTKTLYGCEIGSTDIVMSTDEFDDSGIPDEIEDLNCNVIAPQTVEAVITIWI